MGQLGESKTVSLNQSGEGAGGQKPADWDQQGNDQAALLPPPAKEVTAPSKTTDAKTDAYTEQPNPLQVREVMAQEDMVYWAAWMFVAALATFVVTSIGTLFIWRQVSLTRQAVKDTSEATGAMREANGIARGSAAHQLRAYITIETAELFLRDKKIHFRLRNTGGSQAYKLHAWTTVMNCETKTPDQWHDFGIGDPGSYRDGYIGLRSKELRETQFKIEICYETLGKHYVRTAKFGLAEGRKTDPWRFDLIGGTTETETQCPHQPKT